MEIISSIGNDTNDNRVRIVSKPMISTLDFKDQSKVWLRTGSNEIMQLKDGKIVPLNEEVPDYIMDMIIKSEEHGQKYPFGIYLEMKK